MDLNKLPVWAQKHIADLQRQRDTAVESLNKYVNEQTPSGFYIDEMECTGEQKGPSVKRRYIQAHRMTIEHEDVELNIILRDNYIDLQWTAPGHGINDIAFIPSSFQSARLKAKSRMR